jgi:hypothetical protein
MADNKTLDSETDTGAPVQDISQLEVRQDPDEEALRDEAHRLGVEAVTRALDQPA